MSSLAITSVSELTADPRYTASTVSKSEPRVVRVTLPLAGAVNRHHTDWPPPEPLCTGSPGSAVASTLVPVTTVDRPVESVPAAEN